MLGFVAAILFAIAFIINAANVSISNAIFSPTSLMLLGLVCLALHLSGVGTSWKYRRWPAWLPGRPPAFQAAASLARQHRARRSARAGPGAPGGRRVTAG